MRQNQKVSEPKSVRTNNFQGHIFSGSLWLWAMNPSYIYFKELDIDRENTFNLNFSKENEIDAVLFDKDCEYAITGLNLNVKIPEDQLIKRDYEEKLKKSKEIQKIAEDYKEPDLALYILNSENRDC